jgi:hypothetical protein
MNVRWVSLSLPRRIVADLCHFSLGVPRGVIRKELNLHRLAEARERASVPIVWPVLFVKAYAQVARDMPEFRRSYVKLPWPHLHEHASSAASVVIERGHEGEPALLLARIAEPESLPLGDINAIVRHRKYAPADEIDEFRRALLVARMPLLVRRFLWWLALNGGESRAAHYGTFAISALGSQGVEIVTSVSVWTLLLSYGPIAMDGRVTVNVTFDHRVMDGAAVAGMLAALETTLNGAIAQELQQLDQDVLTH